MNNVNIEHKIALLVNQNPSFSKRRMVHAQAHNAPIHRKGLAPRVSMVTTRGGIIEPQMVVIIVESEKIPRGILRGSGG